MKIISYCLAGTMMLLSCSQPGGSHPDQVNDATAPLHLMQPDYQTPYGTTQPQDISAVLNRVLVYLDSVTPARVVDGQTGQSVDDLSRLPEQFAFAKADYRLTSYEWGVTYAGMLSAAEATGDERYAEYVSSRLNLLVKLFPACLQRFESNPQAVNPLKGFVAPHALDDCGALCAGFIKAHRAGLGGDIRPVIDHQINYITNKEFRLSDGTLARNRPLPNTIWLDDLFMSVPALAQMGKLTGESKYFDDAVKQVLQFSQRMFVAEKGLFMHGWVQGMEPHPAFHWGRANGWAFMTMAELLDVLPESHPGYDAVLAQFRAHAKGLAACQSGEGFWHQLLDRNDSYLETSATAIYTYCFAKGINRGWLNPLAYGPCALLGWNAVATKVTDRGQVEGTCVGTGMGFDPAFYYYRPVNVFAAHSYGPVLLAGSEMIKLLKLHPYTINDSSVQFGEEIK
ncbi:rhamnogalacturonyl hydrolase YesR [Breznakibacter xylanolyticus]|uniref:Rhamnogalacturonyl hydrolase YesR n=1 Tax=Breznakibacter xylanolyticus TaxID=990 RepID=A0A2W7NFE2_9BACT|nr:glycoside hydrolase family 88 protein [Breznakibacter xylanolyticus]PZX18640.1 rhamnogalacturonyl hydrolase YesR [Breznakibacter xylanolyticus]